MRLLDTKRRVKASRVVRYEQANMGGKLFFFLKKQKTKQKERRRLLEEVEPRRWPTVTGPRGSLGEIFWNRRSSAEGLTEV